MYQRERNPSLFLGGERTSGQDVRSANGKNIWILHHLLFTTCRYWIIYNTPRNLVLAAVSIANIVKSSLGPVGLDKMLVDEIGVSRTRWEPATAPSLLKSFPTSKLTEIILSPSL